MVEKNSYINVEETEISKEIPKPKICNPLPVKRKSYHVSSDGTVIFDHSEAVSDIDSKRHNP